MNLVVWESSLLDRKLRGFLLSLSHKNTLSGLHLAGLWQWWNKTVSEKRLVVGLAHWRHSIISHNLKRQPHHAHVLVARNHRSFPSADQMLGRLPPATRQSNLSQGQELSLGSFSRDQKGSWPESLCWLDIYAHYFVTEIQALSWQCQKNSSWVKGCFFNAKYLNSDFLT